MVNSKYGSTDEANGHSNPMTAAQQSMRPHRPKRFYKDVRVQQDGDSYTVTLDRRAVKTPGRNPIRIDNEKLAIALASEFDRQVDEMDPADMPLYRLVNTAIDGVAADPQAVLEDVIRFASSDLLCYRAEAPEGLVDAQSAHWDEPLDWIASEIGARFILAEGIVHATQPKAVISGFGVLLKQFDDPLQVAALHAMTSLLGSAILALAVARGVMTDHEAWLAAHVDEDWNIAQWGEDAEAKTLRASKWRQMQTAASVF